MGRRPDGRGRLPEDPVFWLHHSFIDLLWDRWRKAHPKSAYLPGRKPAAPGRDRDYVFGLDDPMPPWNVTPRKLLDHSKIYRYA